MPTFKFKGIDEYLSKLEAVDMNATKYIEKAIFDGAKVVADETKSALKSMPVDNSRAKKDYVRKSINEIQRIGLVESFGVTPIQDRNNFINVKTGFDGFNRIGQANVRVARMLESGTSWMQKNPVISKASRRARKKCEQAIKDSLDNSLKKIMK